MIVHSSELQITDPEAAKKTIGLGDVAFAVFHPIAKAIDKVAGTNVQGCEGCIGPGGRRERWNAAIPDVRHPFTPKA
jgi:hypothetical protein